MPFHPLLVLVTGAALFLYAAMGIRVGRARRQFNIAAPAISGNEDFERIFRVQANTLEWLPIFLPALWMFGLTARGAILNERIATVLGVVWIVGRFLYMTGYSHSAGSRRDGYLIQTMAAGILLVGAMVGAILAIVEGT